MSDFHRKIELQSPDDLQYLVSNVRRGAKEKIDKDLPPIEGEDKMRTRVEELVYDYINEVFELTAANITINGLDPTQEMLRSMLNSASTSLYTSVEEYEPFDAKLFERAKMLSGQEDDLIEEIASLRRKVPATAVENAKSAYQTGIAQDENVFAAREASFGETEAVDLKVGLLDRQESVEANWTKGVQGLERLKRTLPETVAKKERAERAEAYALGRERRGI